MTDAVKLIILTWAETHWIQTVANSFCVTEIKKQGFLCMMLVREAVDSLEILSAPPEFATCPLFV